MRTVNNNNIQTLLDYEVAASGWWVGLIGNRWLQHRVASYFAWKVKRKYRAYQGAMAIKAEIERRKRFFGQQTDA